MSRQTSAGILVWRDGAVGPQFLLAHPGGPFWAGKDAQAWSIPKGLVEAGEDGLAAALREFAEELGHSIAGAATPLAPCRTSGKTILAWLLKADLDVSHIRSNQVQMEWPPRSGRIAVFPEIDRAAYFDARDALVRVHKGQRPILVEAMTRLGAPPAVD